MSEITVTSAETTISITALPGFAVSTPTPQVTAIIASPEATSIDISDTSESIVVSSQINTFGGLVAQPSITLNVGTQQDPVSVNQSFSNFKYKFPNFVDAGTSAFSAGDIVYFNDRPGYNTYNVDLKAVNVADEAQGASNALFVFEEHTSAGTLVLLHKGFYDYETSDSRIDTWKIGQSLYLNQNNKIDTGADFTGGQWVRSIGFAVPNTDGKYRVWFDGDSTYVKLSNTT